MKDALRETLLNHTSKDFQSGFKEGAEAMRNLILTRIDHAKEYGELGAKRELEHLALKIQHYTFLELLE